MARRRKGLLSYFRLPGVPELGLEAETKKGIFIVLVLAVGAISFLALFDLAGTLGVTLRGWLISGFGWGRFIVPVVLLGLGYVLFKDDRYELRFKHYLGLILLLWSLHAIFFQFINQERWPEALLDGQGGGYFGFYPANFFVNFTGAIVSFIIFLAVILVSFQMAFSTSLKSMFGPESLAAKILFPFSWIIGRLFNRGEKEGEGEKENEDGTDESEDENNGETEEEQPAETKTAEAEETDEEDNEDESEETGEEDEEDEPKFVKAEIKEEEMDWWQKPSGLEFKLSLNLLDEHEGNVKSGDIDRNKEVIRSTLKNFGIPVEMGEVRVGPTFTQFTFRPAEGINLSRITSLSNNIAMALAAHPIRIVAPIPNTSLVGIEVPNIKKSNVSLKGMLQDRQFRHRETNMLVPLGKNVEGKPIFDDLMKMPHLLVAGATNSGKSVALNSIIISLLYQNNPDDLRFILIDPKKGVELADYDDIPYLMTPVVSDLPRAVQALSWCVNEMDKRYRFLGGNKIRKIQDYNKTAKVRMPYIVIVIDELAELMLTAVGKQIEMCITRLTQLGRAAGIHVIVATQKPLITVITSLIKSNITARIGFQVASNVDSRTILDHSGSEKLLGTGDMLFIGQNYRLPIRLQGPFIKSEEIGKITNYIRSKKKPLIYLEEIQQKQKLPDSGGGSDGNEGGDEHLAEARDMIINSQKASASYLQRRLGVGYARAARILDILEEEGFIGPVNGAKPREILVTREEYEAGLVQGVSGVALHKRSEAKPKEEYFEAEDTPPVFKVDAIGEESEEDEDGEDEDEEDDIEEEGDEEESEEENKEDENEEDVEDEEIPSEAEPEKSKPKKIEHDDMPEKLFSR